MNTGIYVNIIKERDRQDLLWGFPQGLNLMEWSAVAAEEAGELIKELNNAHQLGLAERLEDIEKEAIQLAAVAVSIIEHLHQGKERYDAECNERQRQMGLPDLPE